MRSPSDWSYPAQFTVLFGVVVAAALLVAASTSTTAFGAYNTAWDGTADLRSLAESSGVEIHLGQNTSAYTDSPPEKTVALILAPDQSYKRRDTALIARFVRDGGTLIVADERAAPTNALLAAIGADARIDGAPLRDERVHYRSPTAPTVRNLSDHPAVADVSSITLNHGSAVEPGNATVLARTSGYAYRDTNENTELDDTEAVTGYPVVTGERVGQGQIVVVGDASLFINDMLERSGNRQFARNLFASGDHLLLDDSHTSILPPLIQATLFLRNRPFVQFLCGGLGVLAIALLRSDPAASTSFGLRAQGGTNRPQGALRDLAAGTAGTTPSPVQDSTLVAYLRTEYSDWDADRLHRAVIARRRAADLDEQSTVGDESPHDRDARDD
jgi:hypothetical protein